MNITQTQIIYCISMLQQPTAEQFTKWINQYPQYKHLWLPLKLSKGESLKERSVDELVNYFTSFLTGFLAAIGEPFNDSELAWYAFYLAIRSYEDQVSDNCLQLYLTYNQLPQLVTDRQFVQYIQYGVYTRMIAVLMAIDVPQNTLHNHLEMINEIPHEIKILPNSAI